MNYAHYFKWFKIIYRFYQNQCRTKTFSTLTSFFFTPLLRTHSLVHCQEELYLQLQYYSLPDDSDSRFFDPTQSPVSPAVAKDLKRIPLGTASGCTNGTWTRLVWSDLIWDSRRLQHAEVLSDRPRFSSGVWKNGDSQVRRQVRAEWRNLVITWKPRDEHMVEVGS